MAQNDGAAPCSEEGERVFERMKALVGEAAQAMRRTTDGYLEGQKGEAAKRLLGLAEALKECTRAFEQSGNEGAARCAESVCVRLEEAASLLHQRHWRELAADSGNFARREPALYLLSALALGFLGGAFLLASADRPASGREPEAEGSRAPARGSSAGAKATESGGGNGAALEAARKS